MKKNLLTSVFAGLLLCATGITNAQASSSILFFSVNMVTNLNSATFNPPPAEGGTGTDQVSVFGTFNGYASPGLILVRAGSSTLWTNSYNDVNDANASVVAYRFMINGNLEPVSCYDNRAAYLPAVSGASIALPAAFYGGNGPAVSINVKFQVDMSEEMQLGHFHNGDTVHVAGSFNGWNPNAGSQYILAPDPSILVTNYNFSPPLILSNVYTGTIPITTSANPASRSDQLAVTNEIQEWLYVEMPFGSWGNPKSAAYNDRSGNRFFIDNTNQVLPLVTFDDSPYAPLATVTLKVDMSSAVLADKDFVPNSVVLWGSFNGWVGPLTLTNNPGAANTNLFSVTTLMPEGVDNVLQVRYTNSAVAAGNPSAPWVYDYINDRVHDNNARRVLNLPITTGDLNTNVPVFSFLDLTTNDFLLTNTAVRFTVDMTGAVGTDSHVFVPGTDGVYVNGMFANGGGLPYPQEWYAWSGLNPVSAPTGYQMTQVGSTLFYTNTIVLPAGTTPCLQYQYGIDAANFNGGPVEDESPAATTMFVSCARRARFLTFSQPIHLPISHTKSPSLAPVTCIVPVAHSPAVI